MKIEPIKFCWIELGEGKVCERVSGHEGECSPDPTVDFPIESSRRHRVELPDPNWLRTKTGRVLTDADIKALADEAEQGYDVDELRSRPLWRCPHCGRTNRNANDVENHYCGHCHHFCDDVDAVVE